MVIHNHEARADVRRSVDIRKLISEAPIGMPHMAILFWCSLMIVFDGYDLAVAGIALPAIMQAMGVGPAQAGLMVSSALIGMMVGNFLCGSLAERHGRKRVISACVVVFSAFTAAAGLTHDPLLFSVLRFIAGIGIGGVMPNVVAEMTEYSPQRLRSTMVTIMFSGYSLGGMVAAMLGKALIADYDWPAVFLPAAIPVALVPFAVRALPESMTYLASKGRTEEIKRVAGRLNPGYTAQAGDLPNVGTHPGSRAGSWRALFEDGRTRSTLMFWIACFTCLFMVYALSSWLTKLMASTGYSLGSSMTFVLVLNGGAIAGAIAGGWLADRFSIQRVLVGMYLVAAASIAVLPWTEVSALRYVLVALAGATTIGTQILNTAYASQFYPTAMRGTGVGWTLGMGRTGAIVAPVAIGALIGISLPLKLNFIAIALPGLLAAIAVSLIDHQRSESHGAKAA